MKIYIYLLSLITITLSFSGCTAKLTDPEIDFAPPKYVEQLPAKEDQQDYALVGSIFGQGDNPLFTDHKAMHVNDIVTIVISESARSTHTGSKSLTESDNLNLGAGLTTYGGDNSLLNTATKKVNSLPNSTLEE